MRPPPPTGTTTCCEVGDVLEQLQAERGLAEDDVGVIERVHESGAGLLRAGAGGRDAGVHRVALEVHDAAEGLHRRDLGHRRLAGHEHLAGDALGPRRVGQRLAVVAGAARHHARGVPEAGDLVDGAAQLERAGALEVLGLEQEPPAAALRQAARAQHRRVARQRGDDLRRGRGLAGGDAGDDLVRARAGSCGAHRRGREAEPRGSWREAGRRGWRGIGQMVGLRNR